METVFLPLIGTVAAFRKEARRLLAGGVPGEAILWRVGIDAGFGSMAAARDLFALEPASTRGATMAGTGAALSLPKDAIASIETALHHSDPERFARAYDLLSRLSAGTLRWGDRSDRAMAVLLRQEKAVRRDIHKMHAFVRFREIGAPDAGRRAFAAWFEPDHPIVEVAAPFFARRFGDMDWVIATPTLTARFEAGRLGFEETLERSAPPEDATQALWLAYFANIFNPARLMVSAMTSEMPRKYWKNLPEAELIPELIRTAPERAFAMQAALPTEPSAFAAKVRPLRAALPDDAALTLETLKPALDACRRCPIGGCATQGVAGEGPADARLMIVGEQPGDQEDLAGRPFVGPAGQLLDRCAADAGLDRSRAYVTNAVKHFKFAPRGKRRMHSRPDAGEISACKWWLDFERRQVRPKLLVAMGASAALSLTGSGDALTRRRGKLERADDGTPVLITWHPSFLLRLPDPAEREARKAEFVADLARAADTI